MSNDSQTYVTIKELAAMARVTPQAIYNRINDPDVQTFVKLEKGRKVIDTRALDLFTTQTPDKPIEKALQSDITQTLDTLTDQLAAKDLQIFNQSVQIAELNERLKEANQLNSNNQVLIGRSQEPPTKPQLPTPEKKKPFWKFWG